VFSSVPSNAAPTPESILKKYPATNKKYTLVMKSIDAIKYVMGTTHFVPTIFDDVTGRALVDKIKNEHLFVGKLREVRHHACLTTTNMEELPDCVVDGHVYDPWFRDISRQQFNGFALTYQESHSVQVGNSFTKHLVMWVYNTTVDKVGMSVLIYDYVDVYYTNSIRTNKFYTDIAPTSVKTDILYNLLA
jgi:hypothetical protein